ncbi:hypothetical protein CVT26_012052 [Gymnopilus dilepis]|uniref:Uncharacterized protein n=1 Tax=Gymnopilus dilepis TaxID=231916 RepID=A0A409WP37_9AGAR|nr:hypothetical protein CVT26_012052 [Gymnopilus dilepis]
MTNLAVYETSDEVVTNIDGGSPVRREERLGPSSFRKHSEGTKGIDKTVNAKTAERNIARRTC